MLATPGVVFAYTSPRAALPSSARCCSAFRHAARPMAIIVASSR